MNDHDAIRRLLADYCFATDAGDTERWLGTMTDDIVWDGGDLGGFEGKEAGRAGHSSAGDGSAAYQHINTNHLINVDGDTATVQSYVQVINLKDLTAGIIFAGYYSDKLVKRDGQWLISRRELR